MPTNFCLPVFRLMYALEQFHFLILSNSRDFFFFGLTSKVINKACFLEENFHLNFKPFGTSKNKLEFLQDDSSAWPPRMWQELPFKGSLRKS